jgi:hypothetical protein
VKTILLLQSLSTLMTHLTLTFIKMVSYLIYDKQEQQRKAALNERNPHTTQQQEPVVRSAGGPQTKTGQGTRQVNH